MGRGSVNAHVNGVDDRAALTLALRRDRAWVDRGDALPLENGFHERSSTSQGSGGRWKSTVKTYFTQIETAIDSLFPARTATERTARTYIVEGSRMRRRGWQEEKLDKRGEPQVSIQRPSGRSIINQLALARRKWLNKSTETVRATSLRRPTHAPTTRETSTATSWAVLTPRFGKIENAMDVPCSK